MVPLDCGALADCGAARPITIAATARATMDRDREALMMCRLCESIDDLQLTIYKLHIAERDGFTQRREWIAARHELVRQVAGESGVDDRAADGGPVDLLRVV